MKVQQNEMTIETSYNFRKITDRLTSSGAVKQDVLKTLAALGYEAVINLMPDDSEYAVAGEREIIASQKLEYIYIPVDFKHPVRSDFAAFTEAMDRITEKKVHMHCAANYRVSAFYALYAFTRGLWEKDRAWAFINDLWQPDDYPGWPGFIDDILNMTPDNA